MIKLNEKYNPEAFATFLREFLPEDFEEKEKDIADISKCKVIRKAREIGHCPSLDVTVLEMEHDKETDPRVTIATDAFKLLALYGIDKALVVFNNKESDNYRFSYLTIKLDLDEKGKIKQSYSNARRYSFFLGTGAKVKTPEQQLIKKGRVKDVDDLLSRFSLEVVNKQFYLEVAKYFDELVKTEQHHLELPFQSEPNVRKNFAMRLIGRLTFCWFLKQKKSASGQLISEQLLSSDAVGENYYHSKLEPLFFEVLNTQIDARDVRNDLYDKVPYLNGGLFSPQTDDYYDLDRGTFASKYINTLKVSDTWFKDFFLLLETYNFTIDENTVFDQELSVDPEMLGRIFENLLAEINPETGSSDRKRTGSFYTPRQIVEYMVDQSLLEFLKTKTGIDEDKLEALISYDMDDDAGHPRTVEENRKVVEAIEALKVLDPACGSGAFPMGALQKIVWILQQVDPDCKLWLEQKLAGVPDLYRQKIVNYFNENPPDYIRKLDVIKNSIFGVDIQPIAVEISRLRCFLTLVVESEIDDRKQNRGIEPLPNLDFKFVCANTLIGLPKSEEKGLFEDHSGIEELSRIMSEYFSCSNQRKAEIRLRFTNTQKDILNKSLRQFGGATGDLTVKLTLWDPFSNKSNPWFDPEWMFGVEEKFDVVIGNPPYFVYQGHSKGEIPAIRRLPAFEVAFGGKLNAYKLFLALTPSFLNEHGLGCLIFQNSFLADNSAKKLREYFLNKKTILSIDSFPERDNVKKRVFENVKMSVCITLFKNLNTGEKLTLRVWESKYMDKGFETTFSTDEIKSYDPKSFAIPALRNFEKQLFTKVYSQSVSEVITCFEGELNMTFHRHYFTSNKSLPKIVKGAAVQRYQLTDSLSQGEVEYLNEEQYLNENSRSKKASHHKMARIAMQGITGVDDKRRLVMALVPSGIYCANSCNYIIVDNDAYSVEFILGLMNSKLFNWLFKKTSTNSNVNCYEVENLPIPSLDNTTRVLKIEGCVKKLLSEGGNLDCEYDVDEAIYELFNLTEEEKEIVRNS